MRHHSGHCPRCPEEEEIASRPRIWACGLVLALATALALPAPAEAVSLRDLVALSQAGLSDDILVALVEADGDDFALDARRIMDLRAQGVSETVILAMLRVSRERRAEVQEEAQAAPDPDDGAPIVVIIGEQPAQPPPPPRREVILVPWFPVMGPAPVQPPVPYMAPEQRGFGRFMNDGWQRRPEPR
jgi:hypothetical protein